MSFIEVHLVAKDGKPAFRLGESELIIPAASDFNTEMAASASSAEKLKVGLRASQPSLSSSASEQHNVPTVIYLVVSQGHRNLITVKLGKDLVQVVTTPEQTWEVGEQAWLSIHSKFLHVFTDGRAIYHPDVQAV